MTQLTMHGSATLSYPTGGALLEMLLVLMSDSKLHDLC